MNGKTLIPESLLSAKSLEAVEDWKLNWQPTTDASMRDEVAAANALATERFVRRNVSRQKFQEWMQENPRSFTTRREQEWLKQRAAALVQLCEPAPARQGRNPAQQPVPTLACWGSYQWSSIREECAWISLPGTGRPAFDCMRLRV